GVSRIWTYRSRAERPIRSVMGAISVNPQVFGIAFLLGSGAIALWLDGRFPRWAPADMKRALLRVGIALGAGQVLFPRAWGAVVANGSVLAGLFAIALPCLTYVLL